MMFEIEFEGRPAYCLSTSAVIESGFERLHRAVNRDAHLEMHLHLTNGSNVRFVQPDPEEAERLLVSLQPQRLFRKPQIILAGENSLTTIPTAAVEEVSLLLDSLPCEWVTLSEGAEVTEFAPDQLASGDRNILGDVETDIFGEFELRSGRLVYLRIRPVIDGPTRQVPIDRGLAVSHFFERHVILGRRAEGGIFLLNPTNIVRFTTFAPAFTSYSFNPKSESAYAAGALPAGQYFG